MTTTWVAGFRSAVISPHEAISLNPALGFADRTVRQVLHLDGGGAALRVRLSNRYGRAPLTVATARVALRTAGSGIDTGTDTPVRFEGEAAITIPAGADIVSDPVELAVRAGDDLALSLHLPEDTGPTTYSPRPVETGYVVPGDRTSDEALADAAEIDVRPLVTGVDVLAPEGTAVAVAFGDSWFGGVGSTPGANRRMPNLLNQRLDRGWVVNQGIAGNRLLRDGIGEHALARFEHDVLAVPGVRHVLLHFGINDLALPRSFEKDRPLPTEADLIAGFTALAHRAHDAGLTVTAGTIGPFAGVAHKGVDTPEGRVIRHRVNDWLRDSKLFDAVADFAAAVQDPDRPDHLAAEFDSGDHLHLGDAGAQALADSVDIARLGL
ncbi:GDSL-type esterase/lipase family protein [Saccharopolyspora taberi]|uniref:SGNH/GDSL hydrolase family protein n=1 Tax=Saccharopolyspora taberi TaxID=60895 RepID=A0ABN3VE44_9PSEU